VINRYQQHLNGSGSAWTRKYKPILLEKTIKNVSSFEEDKITKEYMAKYGIDKVRGGSYVELELSEFHMDALNMEIWAAKDLCKQCGRKGHFIKDCYANKTVNGDKIEYEEVYEKPHKPSGSCFRCGRKGHYSPDCYARTHDKGYTIDSDDSDNSDDSD